jgi:hypothetical protein
MGYGGPRGLDSFACMKQARSTFGDLTENKIIVDVFHFVCFWQCLSHVGHGGLLFSLISSAPNGL